MDIAAAVAAAIENHFDRSLELERTLLEKGKHLLLREVRAISDMAPSDLDIMGRHVLHPMIFPILEKLDRGAGGEFQLTDALHAAAVRDRLLAVELVGGRYDIGDKLGYMKAILEIGMQREELPAALLPYLKELILRTEHGRLVSPLRP